MSSRRLAPLNLPNRLTLLRLVFCGLLLLSMSVNWPFSATVALVLFVLASLTDWLDGSLARARGLVTDLGKLLDPLADKVLITATLVSLVARDVAPMWMVVTIIAREFLITGLRTIAAQKQVILAAERIGKHKTISQMVVVIVSLTRLALDEFGAGDSLAASALHLAELPLYWLALLITIWSGIVYFWRNSAMLSVALEEAAPPPGEAAGKLVSAEANPALGSTPAFKDWGAIVAALGSGAQTIILRKGGIAEGRAGFAAKHPRFWLFPTRFHQQWEQTKPGLRALIDGPEAVGPEIDLCWWAECTDAVYLETWAQVERLAPYHFWSEEIVRERFDYADRPGMTAGIHLLIVRVFQAVSPHRLMPDRAYEGCKSWIEVPIEITRIGAAPVLSESSFSETRRAILSALAEPAVSKSNS